MKKGILLFALLTPACASSCEAGKANAIIADRSGLHGITFSDDATYQSRYPTTACLRVITRNNRDAGLICRSRSSEFLVDNGIGTGETPDPVRTSNHVTVSTAISLYEMQETIKDGRTLYTVDVDCDEQNGAIYRPTSTCNVTYWPLNDGEFIYANMTVENHVSKRQVLSKEEIDLIISRIEK